MHWFALGLALIVALAIIAIGTQYIASPLTATCSFGLRFLGMTPTSRGGFASRGRDIVSGLTVLAFMM
jgi:hypothetical protein